jgi:hypothetical protein
LQLAHPFTMSKGTVYLDGHGSFVNETGPLLPESRAFVVTGGNLTLVGFDISASATDITYGAGAEGKNGANGANGTNGAPDAGQPGGDASGGNFGTPGGIAGPDREHSPPSGEPNLVIAGGCMFIAKGATVSLDGTSFSGCIVGSAARLGEGGGGGNAGNGGHGGNASVEPSGYAGPPLNGGQGGNGVQGSHGGGAVPLPSLSAFGGAIYNAGTLKITGGGFDGDAAFGSPGQSGGRGGNGGNAGNGGAPTGAGGISDGNFGGSGGYGGNGGNAGFAEGGAIYNDGTLTISANPKFTDNEAVAGAGGTGGYGGNGGSDSCGVGTPCNTEAIDVGGRGGNGGNGGRACGAGIFSTTPIKGGGLAQSDFSFNTVKIGAAGSGGAGGTPGSAGAKKGGSGMAGKAGTAGAANVCYS